MQFIDYGIASSNKKIDVSSDIITFYNALGNNLESYQHYLTRSNIKLPSDHIMVKICNCISDYWGDTPVDTYENIRERARYLSGFFGIASIGADAEPANISLGKDLMVFVDVPSYKVFSGNVPMKSYKPFNYYTHDSVSIDPENYHYSVDSDMYSLVGVNVPLLGALMQIEYHKQVKAELTFDLNAFLNKWMVSEPLMDLLNIAMMNRFEADAKFGEDSASMYGDIDKPRPYNYRNSVDLYSRARRSFKKYLVDIGNGNISDLNNNIPLLYDTRAISYIANFDDYYLDNLMWINAYAEVSQYRRLKSVIKGNKLHISTQQVDRRLKQLLSPHRFDNYLTRLSPDAANYISDAIKY